ncbi:MAG: zinc ribbon domain-containing protein [Deltaproteobacteria bacterium]|nr:zinc ribbon domain-containing protein [Deltaproteobacteria bacterium]
MPTYEYQCDGCGDEFEKEQRITEPAGAVCPSCGSSDTHRLISLSSFVLKGSGWYVTDYGRKDGNGSNGSKGHKKNGNGKDSGTSKKPETPSEGKSESKSDSGSGAASESKKTAHAPAGH